MHHSRWKLAVLCTLSICNQMAQKIKDRYTELVLKIVSDRLICTRVLCQKRKPSLDTSRVSTMLQSILQDMYLIYTL